MANKKKVNYGYSIVKKIAQLSANKVISSRDIVGIPSEFADSVKVSKLKTILKRMEKELSIRSRYALVSIIIDDRPFFITAKPSSWKIVGNTIENIVLFTDNFVEIGESLHQLYLEFNLVGGKVIKSNFYIDEETSEKVKYGEDITYPGDKIPVELFENNEDGTSDIENGSAQCLVEELNGLYSEVYKEFQRSRMQFSYNALRGAGKDGNQWESEIENPDYFVHEIMSPDGAEQQSINLFVQNTMESNAELRRIIQAIENDILKVTLSWLPSSATGTNKHNQEAMQWNQEAQEYIDSKVEIREESLTSFFEKVASQVGYSGDINITLSDTKFEKEVKEARNGGENVTE